MATNLDRRSADESHTKMALLEQREWLRVTLSCIGDAVVTADADGGISFLNAAAQSLTGWTQAEAVGLPLEAVVRVINEESREPVENPAARALRDGVIVGLANHSLLIARDGTERPVDDSAAPIRNEAGEIAGVVLIFRDCTERRRHEREVQEALYYAEEIVATLREPFLVLDRRLRVLTANAAFYRAFHASKDETAGRFIYDLGNGQWDIPRLRTLLEEAIPKAIAVHDFEVEHDFPAIGPKSMLLNARRFPPDGEHPTLVLLAIEDVTERRRWDAALQDSELRFRRLFQTAKDGILILDTALGTIIEANPFMCGLLGYEIDDFLDSSPLCTQGFFCGKNNTCVAATRALRENASGGCTPVGCDYWGATCGPQADGCGGTIQCGACPGGQLCEGIPSQCVTPPCTVCNGGPCTCDDYPNINCGLQSDGCSGTIDCDSCPTGTTCGGGGVPSVCGGGCIPLDCETNYPGLCGLQSDGCGGTLNCDNCVAPAVCGGDPTKPATCAIPCPGRTTCAQQLMTCGETGDGCGNILQCGTCTAPDTCGGGGTPSQCGHPKPCQPRTCAQIGSNCGGQGDGCGGLLNCGTCSSSQVCRGAPEICVNPSNPCTALTCADYQAMAPAGTHVCGPLPDGCGGETPNCGTCASPETCDGDHVFHSGSWQSGTVHFYVCGTCGGCGAAPCPAGDWTPVGCNNGLSQVGAVCGCQSGSVLGAGGACTACGGDKEPPCDTGTDTGCTRSANGCNPGTILLSNGFCAACGGDPLGTEGGSEPACANGCLSGVNVSGRCYPCGGTYPNGTPQFACNSIQGGVPGNICTNPDTILVGNQCFACGTKNHTCCKNRNCTDGSSCAGSGNGTCTCGGAIGQACCPQASGPAWCGNGMTCGAGNQCVSQDTGSCKPAGGSCASSSECCGTSGVNAVCLNKVCGSCVPDGDPCSTDKCCSPSSGCRNSTCQPY